MHGVSHHRRTSFAVVFALLSMCLSFMSAGANLPAWQIVTGWLATNAMILCIAYCVNWPGVYGKSAVGSLRWPTVLLMAPTLLFIRLVWQLQNTLSRTPLYNEIAPDLFVGRLCGYDSLPKGVTVVIDLTAEFQTPQSLRAGVQTICLPTLDGCPPDWMKCQQMFELIGLSHQRIYICCANGHGRSVTFMAAWLGQQGRCHSATEAVKLIQAARPTAAPNGDQMSFLAVVFQTMKRSESVG